jgi:hypothetical protein
MNTLVRLSAEPTRTRVLITQGPMDIGKLMLPPPSSAHPRAMATLLEGLSLFAGERLSVALCVGERSDSSSSLGLLDALGFGERSPFYEIGVAARDRMAERRQSRRATHLRGHSFEDLRQISWEFAR